MRDEVIGIRVEDFEGVPASGYRLFTYSPVNLDSIGTYNEEGMANCIPIILDSNGCCCILGKRLKVVLTAEKTK